jgi:hypothetical protein
VDGAHRYQIEIVLSAQPYGAFEIESGPVAGLRITARDVMRTTTLTWRSQTHSPGRRSASGSTTATDNSPALRRTVARNWLRRERTALSKIPDPAADLPSPLSLRDVPGQSIRSVLLLPGSARSGCRSAWRQCVVPRLFCIPATCSGFLSSPFLRRPHQKSRKRAPTLPARESNG